MGDNPIKYSDLIAPDSSISDLIQQLTELSATYNKTVADMKKEAQQLAESLRNVSGATESGRKTTKEAATDADKLAKAMRDLEFAQSDTAKQLAVLKQAQKEANDIAKLQAKRASAAAGSYQALSAQYSLNKITLNTMSAEEREATATGRALVEETNAIYQEMKRLQEETGKYSLNVGNYGEANVKLTSQVRELTQQLAAMRLEGKQGTQEYNALLEQAGKLKDAMSDASAQVRNMASDTSKLDSVLGAASATSGGFAAATGAMSLFGVESEGVQVAQKKLQAAIAITNGLTAIQNNLQKQSALMLGVSKIQQAALTKAKAYDRLITMQGTKATLAATVAQKAFNVVAMANPYVLLAVALVSVVGALVAFSAGTESAAKKQERLNAAQKAWLDFLDAEQTDLTRATNDRIKALTHELNIAKARNASLQETRQIEDEILSEREKAANLSEGFRADELESIDKNIESLGLLRQELIRLQNIKNSPNRSKFFDATFYTIDGTRMVANVDNALKKVQDEIDLRNRRLEVGLSIKENRDELDAEIQRIQAQRTQEDLQLQRQETQILRSAEDARIALIQNSFDQQRAVRKAAAQRTIADIQFQLQTEANLTAAARKALNAQMVSVRQQLANDLLDIQNQQNAAELALRRAAEDAILQNMQEGADKRRAQLKKEYDRQIEDIQIRLETERGLTVKQTEALIQQQTALRQQYAERLEKLETQINTDQLQKEADRLQLRLDAVREGSEEEINLRIALLQKQRQIELQQNKQLAADLRQNESDINAKYDAEILRQTSELNTRRALLIFDQQQQLEASEFDLLQNSEAKKQAFALEQEKKRLQLILKLHQQFGSEMTDAEIQSIKNTIEKINQEIDKVQRPKDIWDILGFNLDDEKKEALNTSVNYAIDQVNAYMDALVAAADKKVELADKEVDRAQKVLDAEIEARNNGYANNVAMAQKELDNARKNQQKALQDQQKAQKQQAAIQALEQVGSLVTASAKIWGQLGFPWAIPAIAIMWGSFAASKIKAAQLTKSGTETYGDGTVELLQGGSHQSGNDIDLGTKPDGTRRRAEGGEFFAVINKRNSRRFRRYIPDVINSLNNGTFAKKYLSAYQPDDSVVVNMAGNSPDLRELSADVRDIKEQYRRRTYVDGRGNTIETYKNLRRKIKIS